MAPSITENNTAGMTDADIAEGSSLTPGKENHETDPTEQGGESLMWSQGSQPLSSESAIYIVTSDYDPSDESTVDLLLCWILLQMKA